MDIGNSDNKQFSHFLRSPVQFDKDLKEELTRMFPRKPRGPGLAAADLRASGQQEIRSSLAAKRPGPMLDTTTPPDHHFEKTVSSKIRRLKFGKSTRKMYSRIMLGLQLPGNYYFVTLTSTPSSPSLVKTWPLLSKWLHRYRPGMSWIYCFTNEGHGVIHMIIRLGKGEKRIDVRVLRKYWESLTGARQLVIRHVAESQKEDLAAYLVNQKRKKGLGRELIFQNNEISAITRWKTSKGWLPLGFGKTFGRLWVQLIDAPDGIRYKLVNECLMRCYHASIS